MDWQFVPVIAVSFFGILFALFASRKKEARLKIPPFFVLKILLWSIPLLFFVFYYLKPPFPAWQGFSSRGFGIGILLGGLSGTLLLFSLRLPASSYPPPSLLSSTSLPLLLIVIAYFLPYDLPIFLFGFLIAFSLITFLSSAFLKERPDEIGWAQNVALLLALALTFGVFHSAMSEKKLPEELWYLLPLSLSAIALLSFFASLRGSKMIRLLLVTLFFLTFIFALSYFYFHHLPFFFVSSAGSVTGAIVTLLLLETKDERRISIVVVLLLLGLFAISFRLLRAYGVCLAGLSLIPFSALIFSEDNPKAKRTFNLFLLSIAILAIFRIFYQLFSTAPFVAIPSFYDFFPFLGLLTGVILLLILPMEEKRTPLNKLLISLLSLIIFSFLVAIYGLNASVGIFAGALIGSIILLFLYLRGEEFAFPSFAIFLLLLAILLTPLLSPLSAELKRVHKFYITLGTVPLACFLVYLLARGKEKEK